MSQAQPSLLKLSISTEWETYELLLNPGDSFTIGRSPDCRIPVPRASVSQEHLRLSWSGLDLKIEDLKSANGTVRLPQESPFVAASFSKKSGRLDLRLSKSPVSFSWIVLETENFKEPSPQLTKTEVAENEKQNEDSGLKLKALTQSSAIRSLSSDRESGDKTDAKEATRLDKKQGTLKAEIDSPDFRESEKISPANELRDQTQTDAMSQQNFDGSGLKNESAPDSPELTRNHQKLSRELRASETGEKNSQQSTSHLLSKERGMPATGSSATPQNSPGNLWPKDRQGPRAEKLDSGRSSDRNSPLSRVSDSTSARRDFLSRGPYINSAEKLNSEISENSFLATSWFIAGLIAFVMLATSYVFGKNILRGIGHAHSFQLENGGVHDGVLIFLALYREWIGPIVGGLVFSLLFYFLAQNFVFKKRPAFLLPLARMFERTKPRGVTKYKIWIFLAAGLTFCWPVFWGMLYGFHPQLLPRYNALLNVVSRSEQNSPEQNIIELKKFTEVFKGSSLLYKHLFFNQRNRIVKSCGGVGETAPWQVKKNCLILLQAAGTETYEDVRPALLKDVAQRAAILLSLDGALRTAMVEGRGSPGISVFLNSLEGIGLAAEKFDVEKIINSAEFSNARAVSLLQDLRRRVELRLDLRQLELNYPTALYVRIPGPLELNI